MDTDMDESMTGVRRTALTHTHALALAKPPAAYITSYSTPLTTSQVCSSRRPKHSATPGVLANGLIMLAWVEACLLA